MSTRSTLGSLLALLAFLPASPGANAQFAGQPHAPLSSRWAVYNENEDEPERAANCHPLLYFQETRNLGRFDYGHLISPDPPGVSVGLSAPNQSDISDDVSTVHRGDINGFAIYEVIHNLDNGQNSGGDPRPQEMAFVKMILVRRKPGEYCEIYHEQGDPWFFGRVGPISLVKVDSETAIATRDQTRGSGGFYNEAYWTFDKNGPILLDLAIIGTTLSDLLPDGMSVNHGGGFHIESLSFDSEVSRDGDTNCCPTGGHVHIQFALKNHRLVVVDRKYAEN